MAERYTIAPQLADPIETYINYTIDGLIGLLNVRRAQLLEQVRNLREEKRGAEIARDQMIAQLTEARAQLQGTLRENPLQSMQERMVDQIQEKLQDLRNNIPSETQLKLQCDTRELEFRISSLGEIKQVFVGVPNYAALLRSMVATGEKGRGPGELDWPRGVAIHEATNQIFVANCGNDRVEIYSGTGEYLNQLGLGQPKQPYGIAIHGENVYVSSWEQDTVSKFTLTELRIVREIGGKGFNNGQFNCPRQLTTDPLGCVFIADEMNNRISVHDKELNHLRNIKHQSMSQPFDVKVSRDRVYILTPENNPCIHVLTLEGDKLYSLITCGLGLDVLNPLFFCLDPIDNFIVSDLGTNSIRVFSPEGNNLHTIGTDGHQQGMFHLPRGIAITQSGGLVSVSHNENFGLQIFY
ncbi:PEP-CTERM domain protein [Oopsacas minuta]|uniref:PEP-CTERM domain protein n=1 Tax=Oopsacas minuta TaxID=111878 RepID=A0AAV7JDW5_9METZ|nr:PEP-CTERM domain protein [Oopsacas minuta]